MKKISKNILSVITFSSVLLISLVGCEKNNNYKFSPQLNTDEKLTLNILGYFGNFEALDAVTNDFNKYYPNISFNYQQVSGNNLVAFLDSNFQTDIFMTSSDTISSTNLIDYCLDLSTVNLNLNDVDQTMLTTSYKGNFLHSLPIGQNIYGIITNVTLLKKEGLDIPKNYDKFINTLNTLKTKGYVPLQSSSTKIYPELTINMMVNTIQEDNELYNDLINGNLKSYSKIENIFNIVSNIQNNEYSLDEVNNLYPFDNYNDAILRFFEGNVPFWVCNSEKVSGMKKRETKSETFKANPFEYTYIYAPLGDKGSYVYHEPWYGLGISKRSPSIEYAKEFMRFYATKDELNKMASTKGVPSIAKEKYNSDIYKYIDNPEAIETNCIYDGKVTQKDFDAWYTCINSFATKKLSKEEAIKSFITTFSNSHK
ncbi:sugar ABC transporter substrate-binding protein [Firmicutes bacterium CAG:345]|jgi:sugar ABC transporter substrate-binding protein|nr:sugar ABC transporter substrate-binding protein [Firmicutes bacterium CAG:345]